MGKTYTSAFLSNKWAQDRTTFHITDLSQRRKMEATVDAFDFVFLVRLRDVKRDCSLEGIIAEQHELSEEQEKLVRSLLDGSIRCNILLCLDG